MAELYSEPIQGSMIGKQKEMVEFVLLLKMKKKIVLLLSNQAAHSISQLVTGHNKHLTNV